MTKIERIKQIELNPHYTRKELVAWNLAWFTNSEHGNNYYWSIQIMQRHADIVWC